MEKFITTLTSAWRMNGALPNLEWVVNLMNSSLKPISIEKFSQIIEQRLAELQEQASQGYLSGQLPYEAECGYMKRVFDEVMKPMHPTSREATVLRKLRPNVDNVSNNFQRIEESIARYIGVVIVPDPILGKMCFPKGQVIIPTSLPSFVVFDYQAHHCPVCASHHG